MSEFNHQKVEMQLLRCKELHQMTIYHIFSYNLVILLMVRYNMKFLIFYFYLIFLVILSYFPKIYMIDQSL